MLLVLSRTWMAMAMTTSSCALNGPSPVQSDRQICQAAFNVNGAWPGCDSPGCAPDTLTKSAVLWHTSAGGNPARNRPKMPCGGANPAPKQALSNPERGHCIKDICYHLLAPGPEWLPQLSAAMHANLRAVGRSMPIRNRHHSIHSA